MRKFIFGVIALVVVGAVMVLVSRDGEEGNTPAQKDSQKVTKAADSITAEMIIDETAKVLDLDSSFTDEINEWVEVDSLLTIFCEGMANAGVLRGNVDVIAAMDAVNYQVMKIRYNDRKRIIQLNGDKDYASDEMLEYKKNELIDAMDLALELQSKGPIFQSMIDCRGQMSAAIEKWIKTRERYKGSNAITIHEMANFIKDLISYNLQNQDGIDL